MRILLAKVGTEPAEVAVEGVKVRLGIAGFKELSVDEKKTRIQEFITESAVDITALQNIKP